MPINTTDPRFTEWKKSDRSGPDQGCVHVSLANDGSGLVALCEDTDGPGGSILVLPRESWEAFIGGAKDGNFDHI